MFLGLLDPDPISQRFGFGSFYHQAKIVRKTLIPCILLFFDFFMTLSLKMLWIYLQKVISKVIIIIFCWRHEGPGWKLQDPHPDPDPLVRGIDPWIRIRVKISRICNAVKENCCLFRSALGMGGSSLHRCTLPKCRHFCIWVFFNDTRSDYKNNQYCGSEAGSALVLVGLIRIQIENVDSDPDTGGQTCPS